MKPNPEPILVEAVGSFRRYHGMISHSQLLKLYVSEHYIDIDTAKDIGGTLGKFISAPCFFFFFFSNSHI